MKKIRMGLIALAAVTGIGGAFAFNHPAKHKFASKTYYGYIDPSDNVQKWQETRPSLSQFSCQPSNVACTITSTTDEATVLGTHNGYPAKATPQNGSANNVYMAL